MQIRKKVEEISIFSNGGHLGYRMALTDTILKGDHLRIISAVVSEEKIFIKLHSLLSSNFQNFNTFRPLFQKL
jgi:hypothetical protein